MEYSDEKLPEPKNLHEFLQTLKQMLEEVRVAREETRKQENVMAV